MRNAKFPHMEWVKARSGRPFLHLMQSGAPAPRGAIHREYGQGEPTLVARVAKRYGVRRAQVYLAGGTSLANFTAIAAFVDPGDTVAVEHPRYECLAEIPRKLGATIVDVPRTKSGRLGRIPKRARLLVVTDPHNPTGRLLNREDYAAMTDFAERGLVLVDEVYRDLRPRPGPVAAKRHPNFLTTGSLTKAYGLGGVRIGWVLGSEEHVRTLRQVDNLIGVQVSTPSMVEANRIWPRLETLRKRAVRPIAHNLETLRGSGLRFIEPEAGFTVLVDVGDGDAVSAAAEKRGVTVVPGSMFGVPESVRVFLGARPDRFRKGIGILAECAPDPAKG